MTAATFTTRVRYALLALLFLAVGASAAMLMGAVAKCVGGIP